MNTNLPIYLLELDEENEGITYISITDTPANMYKGFAFSEEKPMYFEDKTKLRITSPMLVTNLPIYRKDEDGEYFVLFDEKQGEVVYSKFLKNLKSTGVFNVKHTDKMVDGFLFETILLDNQEKLDFYNNLFNSDMGINSSVMTVQFNSQEDYIDAIANDRVGLSLESYFNLKRLNFNKNVKINMTNEELETKFNSIDTKFEQLMVMLNAIVKPKDEVVEEVEVELEETVETVVEEAEIDEVVDHSVEDVIDETIEEVETEVEVTLEEQEDNTQMLMDAINSIKEEIVKLKAKEQHFDKKEKIVDVDVDVDKNKNSFFENIKNTMIVAQKQ